MVCLAPRALKDSMRPRRLADASVRPLNFTVRVRNKIRLWSEIDERKERRQRHFA